MIVTLPAGIAQAFLIKEAGAILVDTGRPQDAPRLADALARHGVAVADLTLILHTHAHWDHCGSTHQLKEWTRAPLALHRADLDKCQRGDNGNLKPTGLTGYFLRPFIDRSFPPFTPTLLLDGELDLAPYGIRGRIIPTPGHTVGSVSVLTEEGDAIVGDLLMGGPLGGNTPIRTPVFHYYAEDRAALYESLRLLRRLAPRRVYLGHGGPLDGPEVAAWIDRRVRPAAGAIH